MAKKPAAPPPDKHEVHRALLAHLRGQLERMAAVAKDTAEAVTHEDNRSEGDKDMRATEQSYIARGQAMRTEELAELVQRLEPFVPPDYDEARPIGAGALVKVDVEGEVRWLYVLGQGGGTELNVGGHRVLVITPSSPVGRQMVGKLVGDSFEQVQPGDPRQRREWTIEAVS